MTEQSNKKYNVIEKVKSVTLQIHEVEENSVIVNVQGWRIRLYFDEDVSKERKSQFVVGQLIEAYYFGNIEDVHSLKFNVIK